jgi:hypothetical protein
VQHAILGNTGEDPSGLLLQELVRRIEGAAKGK